MIELSNELEQKMKNLEKEKKELEQKINIGESQKNSINNEYSRLIKYYKKYKDLKKNIESKEYKKFNVDESDEESYEESDEEIDEKTKKYMEELIKKYKIDDDDDDDDDDNDTRKKEKSSGKGLNISSLPILLSKTYTNNTTEPSDLAHSSKRLVKNLYKNNQITKQVYNTLSSLELY